MDKIDKIKSILSDEEAQEMVKKGEAKVIDDSKGELIERVNKTIISKDGRLLLREVNREVL
ncbi:MAG: hypothetical protein DDT42_01768 [candidate division WS2 bacterium]|uniref:Uncharacterized protein n=1 Tax=Psychracetigena formicireducens TaxID=2986056 RepID=A0A9E2BHW3_PSYF1|nr:hypothetical protein [Candidatus Psychracetigena formicireducens]